MESAISIFPRIDAMLFVIGMPSSQHYSWISQWPYRLPLTHSIFPCSVSLFINLCTVSLDDPISLTISFWAIWGFFFPKHLPKPHLEVLERRKLHHDILAVDNIFRQIRSEIFAGIADFLNAASLAFNISSSVKDAYNVRIKRLRWVQSAIKIREPCTSSWYNSSLPSNFPILT